MIITGDAAVEADDIVLQGTVDVHVEDTCRA